MRRFTLDIHNDIAAETPDENVPPQEGSLVFATEPELAAVAADWPGSRLVEIWNNLPGSKPIKKFTNRKTAVRRIWQVLQDHETHSKAKAPTKKRNPKPSAAKRAGTKSDTVLALLRQTGGATLQALMAATGWQAHSVRGFISGQVTKKMRLKVRSFTRDGQRVYSIRS
jgi:Protein of unknown function (DUF3489)